MLNWRERRDASGVRYLLETAQDDGVDIQACLAGSAISATALLEPGTTIEAWQELAVIRNLIQQGIKPDFGYRLGRRYHLTSLGLLGFTMLASDNLESALALLDRFQTLALTICPVTTERHPLGLWVFFDERVLPADAQSLVVERGLSGIISLASELMQRNVQPLEVQVKHSAPNQADQHLHAMPYAIQYSTQCNGVLFAQQDMVAPMPQANLSSRFEGERLCTQLIVELDLSPTSSVTVRRVQEVLLESASTLMTSKQVADAIGLSDRTLHRRLAADGKTFAMVNDGIKQKMAERLLAESNISVAAVAQRLGYAEAASFSRAFSRWTGTAPGRWRRSV